MQNDLLNQSYVVLLVITEAGVLENPPPPGVANNLLQKADSVQLLHLLHQHPQCVLIKAHLIEDEIQISTV